MVNKEFHNLTEEEKCESCLAAFGDNYDAEFYTEWEEDIRHRDEFDKILCSECYEIESDNAYQAQSQYETENYLKYSM